MANRYFVCTRNRPPVEFNITNDQPVDDAEISYFIRGFRLLEQTHVFDGYIICFAWGSTVALPVLGDNVIALIYGDEHCRVPRYVMQVGSVMKCHGFIPNFLPRLRPYRLMQIELAELVRNLALWIPTGLRYAMSSQVRERCHLIPLGYGRSCDIPISSIDSRRYLLSFTGSVSDNKPRTLRRLIGTPKAFCRQAMLKVLGDLQKIYSTEQVKVGVTGSFQDSMRDKGQAYVELMAQTKICLASRGTAHETLRIYEALKLGCVVISDRLPAHPFYRNSPIIQIREWSEAPAILERLVDNPDRLEALHRESLRFWATTLSEQALARYYADALKLACHSTHTTQISGSNPVASPRAKVKDD